MSDREDDDRILPWNGHSRDPGDSMARGCLWIVGISFAFIVFFAIAGPYLPAHGRDLDGRYAASPLKPWFDQLKSGKGLCCSDADGFAVQDPDWETKDGHYRVRLGNKWIDVPDEAVITEPNRAGMTMVWPVSGYEGTTIRCFLPGSMT